MALSHCQICGGREMNNGSGSVPLGLAATAGVGWQALLVTLYEEVVRLDNILDLAEWGQEI